MNTLYGYYQSDYHLIHPVNIHWSLHKKPYFHSPAISWKAQKQQVNIIFSFGSKKTVFPTSEKVQNKNFSIISKYNLSINFLAQKRPYFPFPKGSKQELFSN